MVFIRYRLYATPHTKNLTLLLIYITLYICATEEETSFIPIPIYLKAIDMSPGDSNAFQVSEFSRSAVVT